MDRTGKMVERIYLIYRSPVQRRAKNGAIGSDGKILDPGFIWERPEGYDSMGTCCVIWDAERSCQEGCQQVKDGAEHLRNRDGGSESPDV